MLEPGILFTNFQHVFPGKRRFYCLQSSQNLHKCKFVHYSGFCGTMIRRLTKGVDSLGDLWSIGENMMSELQILPKKQQTIQKLRRQIRKAETSSRNDDGSVISSGCEAMDSILPGNGYNRGTIIEWFAGSGSCAEFFSLLAARHAAADGGAIVIVDPKGQFYPPAARAIGINLSNLIVLRNVQNSSRHPHSPDFLWAIDQSLRCNSVAAVWGELPEFEEVSGNS